MKGIQGENLGARVPRGFAITSLGASGRGGPAYDKEEFLFLVFANRLRENLDFIPVAPIR
jgi:hypothetical protein